MSFYVAGLKNASYFIAIKCIILCALGKENEEKALQSLSMCKFMIKLSFTAFEHVLHIEFFGTFHFFFIKYMKNVYMECIFIKSSQFLIVTQKGID